jgi:hypothetical protein
MNLRLKLQRRFAPLLSSSWESFDADLKRFLSFIESNETLSLSTKELLGEFPSLSSELETARAANTSIVGITYSESAALGFIIMKRVAAAGPQEHGVAFSKYVEIQRDMSTTLDVFKDTFVRPFHDMLDERLQDADSVLAELVRVKHAIEWFRRREFLYQYEADTRRGEKNLAWKLYEALYDQGVEFSIEPASISGEADMVSSQNSTKPLVADVKIYDPERSKGTSYLKQGFRQVYTYLEDFNQAVGYLVVFATSAKQVRVTGTHGDGIAPSISVHGKTIFLVQIDIFEHLDSASKRPDDTSDLNTSELLFEIDSDKLT